MEFAITLRGKDTAYSWLEITALAESLSVMLQLILGCVRNKFVD